MVLRRALHVLLCITWAVRQPGQPSAEGCQAPDASLMYCHKLAVMLTSSTTLPQSLSVAQTLVQQLLQCLIRIDQPQAHATVHRLMGAYGDMLKNVGLIQPQVSPCPLSSQSLSGLPWKQGVRVELKQLSASD